MFLPSRNDSIAIKGSSIFLAFSQAYKTYARGEGKARRTF